VETAKDEYGEDAVDKDKPDEDKDNEDLEDDSMPYISQDKVEGYLVRIIGHPVEYN